MWFAVAKITGISPELTGEWMTSGHAARIITPAMGTKWASAGWVATVVALLCAPAWADNARPDCPATAFGDVAPALFYQQMDGACTRDSSRWKVETPRIKPTDTGPSLIVAEYSSLSSAELYSGVTGSVRMDWAGLRGPNEDGGLRTARAALALGSSMQLLDSLTLQTSVGMEQTAIERTRATVTSVWQPFRSGVLFAEWAGSEAGTESSRIGGRLWLVPRRFAIDIAARHLPDGAGWGDERYGVAFNWPFK